MRTVDRQRAWQERKFHEIDWWQNFVATKGLQWKDEFNMRLNPEALLQEFATRWIDPQLQAISILDVGAGPFTMLGKKWPGHEINITAVDPLASDYNTMLRDLHVEPPIWTELCAGEELDLKFQPNSFDLSHSRNALDHSYDPIRIIRNMLMVTKVGGHCTLDHSINEGEKHQYRGLHQWNFSHEDGDMLITSRDGVRSSVAPAIVGIGQIVLLQEGAPQAGGKVGDSGWLFVVIQKTGSKLLSTKQGS